MRRKKLPKIEVRTTPNGYSMAIEGHKQEYMYFSPEKLMEGVMVHVGLHMTEQLSPDMIKSFIDSALEWNNLKASHKELQKAKRETERITNIERAGVQTNQPTAAPQAPQAANAPAAGNIQGHVGQELQKKATDTLQVNQQEDPNDDLPF